MQVVRNTITIIYTQRYTEYKKEKEKPDFYVNLESAYNNEADDKILKQKDI